MRAFWESAADDSSSARQRGTRIIKECKTIRKVPGKPKTVTYTRSTNETGKNPIVKRKRRYPPEQRRLSRIFLQVFIILLVIRKFADLVLQ